MLNVLVSKVCRSCNLKSLSIKYTALNMNCQRTVHICLTITRKPQNRCSCPLTRIRKFFQIHPVSKGLLGSLAFTWKMEAPVLITTMGPLTARIFNLQPFSRFSSLLNFAQILLPVRHTFSHWEIGRNNLHSFSKISANIFSLLDFEMCLHSWLFESPHSRRSCLVHVDVSCCGFMEAGSMRSLALLHMANSMGVVPLRVTCVFLTVAAFRIKRAGVICARVVWSRFLRLSPRVQRETSWTIVHPSQLDLATVCVRACRKCLYVEPSIESLHVMRTMESHVCTNRLRVHLESVHPLMKFGNDFRWRCSLTWVCC